MPATVADVVSRSATGYSVPTIPSGSRNVGDAERLLSVAGGGLLAVAGLNSSGLARVVLPLIGGSLVYRGITGWCAAYSALGIDTACDRTAPATSVEAGHGVKIEEAVTVQKPAATLFTFWRQFSNLPRFMDHLKEVTVTDRNKSHWVAKAPLGLSVSWDAEVINERPNELIAWRSLPGSDIDTAGSVHFTPAAGGGTEVRVVLKYVPPAGKLGHAAAKLFGESPDQQIRSDLRRFKQLMEGGR